MKDFLEHERHELQKKELVSYVSLKLKLLFESSRGKKVTDLEKIPANYVSKKNADIQYIEKPVTTQ